MGGDAGVGHCLLDLGASRDATRLDSGGLYGTPYYAAPEVLIRNESSPASDIYSFGVVIAQALTGLQGEPAQVLGALPPAIARVIDKATDPDPAARYAAIEAFAQDAIRELVGGEEAPEPVELVDVANPYMGLRPFDQTDAALFFGRDRMISTVLARLVEEPGLLVVGPSGCGKSSLVGAGVVPGLRSLQDPPLVTTMVPGPDPFAALVQALEMVATDEANNIGDAPWPPHYPKMPGEPKRVQPSRNRDLTRGNTSQ